MVQAAVVLGSSGSVGQSLMEELLRSGAFRPVLSVGRRTQASQVERAKKLGIELREVLVPEMTADALEAATLEALRGLEGEAVGLSVLGIGAGTAKLTIEEHRAVDLHLNASFARALKASGKVPYMAFMSAARADVTASETASGAAGMGRYNRVKGEAEEAVKREGPKVVSIFRPAMIIGSQHTPKALEKLLPVVSFVTPAKYKSITVEQLAKAMVASCIRRPERSELLHYPEMLARTR